MARRGFSNLREFLQRLRCDAQLRVVDAPVDATLEVAEIHRRVIAAGGPALLFTNVKDSDFSLVTNLFGTAERARTAFGERPHAFVERIADLPTELFPPSPTRLWGARDVALDMLKIGTRKRSRGPVTEVIEDSPRLDRLPALTGWPEDGGPFLTLPLVYTEHPDTGIPNLGMYRMQVLDAGRTAMHWQIGKGGGFHYAEAQAREQDLPVTVFLGGPPALILSAIAPLPENVPELLLASLIAGERLDRIHGEGPHPLIAEAEFALIGSVPPRETCSEGPFGDHYGYYSLRHDYPVFNVQRMARRRDAIFPATIVGKPRQEDFFIGDILQELLSPLFPLVMPAVEKLWSYGETGYHALAAAVVRERYKREAMSSAFRILGEGQLSLTKFLLVLDRAVDLRDFRATLEHLLERTRPEVDLYVFPNLSMDTLDYSGPRVNQGSKGVWLGLGDPIRSLPREFSPDMETPIGMREAHVFCGGCLVIGGPSLAEEPQAARRFAEHPVFDDWPLVVLHDNPVRAVASPMNFLWSTFTRFDPATDLQARRERIEGHHLVREPPIFLDARVSVDFPAELFCDPVTEQRVSDRWSEYFPDGLQMGDSRRGHLDP